jgi:CYTH domain-containing protein
MGVEIERKFTVKSLPANLDTFPVRIIEQGYLNVVPAIRVRREDDHYYMTYKSRKGFGTDGMAADSDTSTAEEIGKTEYNLPLDEDSYEHLIKKADGNVIRKKRYLLPINDDAFEEAFLADHPGLKAKLTIELDVFGPPFEGTIIAEVEFPDEETASSYKPATWFDTDVTGDVKYSNAHMSSAPLRF